jgi:predicted O-methyltransferase YrrM
MISTEDLAREINALGEYILRDGVIFEGGSTLPEMVFLAEQVQGMTLVREIGFNAGLSAYAMLLANPDLHITSYDIGEWPCVFRAREFIDRRFPGRLSLRLGDSKHLLKHDLMPVDLTFVDGGHDFETAYSDIKLTAPTSEWVVVDDLQMDPVAEAVERAIEEKLIVPERTFADRTAWVPRSWLLAKGMR